MKDRAKADRYLKLLEDILSGKDTIDPIEDKEIVGLLKLAKAMLSGDLRLDRELGEELKHRLMLELTKDKEVAAIGSSMDSDELDEEQLDSVAAAGINGVAGKKNSTCPYCGAACNEITRKCSSCFR